MGLASRIGPNANARRRLVAIGTIGVTLRSPGTPAVGLGELLLFPSGVAELFGGRCGRLQKQFTAAACVWSAGSLLSDIVNGSTYFDLLRGQARIWLLLLTLLGASRLARASQLTIPQIVGAYSSAALVASVALPAPSYAVDPWKFGLSLPICLLVLLSVRDRRLGIRCVAVIGLAALNFLLGYRSLGGVLLLVLLLQVFRAIAWRQGRGRITSLILAAVVMLYGLTIAYEEAVRADVFGEKTAKFETQLDGEIGLLSGRIGTVAAILPIVERPIVGWGTWADDPELLETYVEVVTENHGAAFAPAQPPRRFPAHSYLLQGWLESGIGAVPFWLLSALVAFRALRLSLLDTAPASSSLLVDLLFVKFAWDFAFSPYGAETRGLVAVSLLVFSLVIDDHRRNGRGRAQWPGIAASGHPTKPPTTSEGGVRASH